MAYNEFAYFYDEFNGEADYDALYRYITAELQAHGIRDGILADLGCGTGDLTLMLTQAPLIPTAISARWTALKRPYARRPILWRRAACSFLI